MREEGEVVELRGGAARVRLRRHSACGGCRACSALGPDAMLIEADNAVGAAAGERVRVEIMGPAPLRAALLVYGAPLAALLAGCLAGTALTGSEMGGLGAGIAALACAFFALHRYDRRAAQSGRISATVVERLKGGEDDGEAGRR